LRKNPAPQEQKVFDATAFETDPEKIVANAAKWSKALWKKTYDGMGDTQEAAMYRAEQKYGVPAQTFWSLKYRPPKDLLTSIYMRLYAAYYNECERQEAKLRHELELAKALQGGANLEAAIREAEAEISNASINTSQSQGEATE
jgi:hypothetical protein